MSTLKDRKFTQVEERKIASRYGRGERSSLLAEEYGCSLWLIREIARRHGVLVFRKGNRYRSFSKRQLQAIVRRWNRGDSQHSIASSLGCSQVVIGRVLTEAGFRKEKRLQVGERHGMWKGGRVVTEYGYVLVRLPEEDPLASTMRSRSGYVMEHRLTMARHLGRPLLASETVHHVNGKRDDNRIENLQLRQGKHGKGTIMRCKDCGSYNTEASRLTED